MPRIRPIYLFCAMATFWAGDLSAQQEIYKRRDKSGAVHYSSTPPKSGKFERRTIAPSAVAASTAVPAAAATAAKPGNSGENPLCTTARNNLKALNDRSRQVMMDSNGDGKPEAALNEVQRAREIGNTENFMKQNNCAAG